MPRRSFDRIPFLRRACAAGRVASILALGATLSPGEDLEIDWQQVDSALASGQSMAESFLPPGWSLQLEDADATALKDLLVSLSSALEETSPEPLAALQPLYHRLFLLLHTIPEMEPLVSWMEAQEPYLDMARLASSKAKDRAIEPPPPPETEPEATVPVRPGPAVPWKPASVWMVDPEEWNQQVAARAAPAGAERWAKKLAPIFREEGLPEALVWMAEVESSFQPEARSPAGAVGMFQLMPATAKYLGLKVARPDERKRPEKNARAAARYLRALFSRFQSWPLALAAYNAGQGRIAHLLQTHHAVRFDAIRHALPVETQMYIPRVAAVLRTRAGVELEQLPSPTK